MPMHWTRRDLSTALTAALGSSLLSAGAAEAAPVAAPTAADPEGRRHPQRPGGRYQNPIVAGDHPDPTVLKDGSDYYMTFSSFQAYPGAVIWHSRDLVSWTPIVAALTQPIGTVWAMDLVKHQGRFFLYIPVLRDAGTGVFVTWADDIRGPWSTPIDLQIPGCIDPGHVVGEDGQRYLFVNGGRRVRLRPDGLATAGPLEEGAWTPWQYPKDWEVEMFAPEGPKLLRRGNWFYLISAVGGTAGPATSHMVTVARSRSVNGPWEHCPHNPVVRTTSKREPWWSRGHASLVEGPAGDWWMVYHGYESDYRTLGRQCLLEPIEWTADGWFRAKGGTLAQPLPAPRGGQVGPSGLPLSDDFSRSQLGLQWSFHAPGANEAARLRHADGGLVIQGKGQGLADSSPLCCIVGDRSYEITVDLEIRKGELIRLPRPAAAVFVVTADDIRRSGASSIPEVLRMVPGLRQKLERWSDAEVLAAIRRRESDHGEPRPVKDAEFDVLADAREELGTDRPEGDFYARTLPRATSRQTGCCARHESGWRL